MAMPLDAARETEVAAGEIDSTQCEAPGPMVLRCSPRCLELRRARNVFRVREDSAHHNSALPVHLRSYSTAPVCHEAAGTVLLQPGRSLRRFTACHRSLLDNYN